MFINLASETKCLENKKQLTLASLKHRVHKETNTFITLNTLEKDSPNAWFVSYVTEVQLHI